MVMRYSFGVTDYSLPLYIDSISNRWVQEKIQRKQGYPYVHWLQTVSGEGIVTVGNQVFHLREGQGVLIDADTPHEYRAMNDDTWITAYFTFGGELITEMIATLNFSHFIVIKEPDENLRVFIDHCYQRIQRHQLDMYQASIAVYQFLLLIKQNQIKNDVDPHLMAVIIEPITAFIKANYMKDLTNSDYVEQTHYSLQYILTVFRAYFDSFPHQLLIDYRIRKAKELLANDVSLSVAEVGKKVGFNTNSYFISMFKQREKVTPGKFRAFFQ